MYVHNSEQGTAFPDLYLQFLVENDIDILFTIGGDGTLRGALTICNELEKRGLAKSVIGIPKTIDNDILWTDRVGA